MKKYLLINLFLFVSLQNDTIKLIEPLYPHIDSTPAFSITLSTSNLLILFFLFIIFQMALSKFIFKIKSNSWKVILPFNFYFIKETFRFKFLKAFVSFIFILTNELIKYFLYIFLITHLYHKVLEII